MPQNRRGGVSCDCRGGYTCCMHHVQGRLSDIPYSCDEPRTNDERTHRPSRVAGIRSGALPSDRARVADAADRGRAGRDGPAAADPGPPLPAGRGDRAVATCAATATSSASWPPPTRECRAIAFCGVHFMAETADILANRPERLAAARRRARDRWSCPTWPPAARWPTWPRSSRSRTAGSSSAEVIDIERRDAGHLRQLGGQPEGVLRPARRDRLHLGQRRGGARVGLRPAAAACCSSPISTWAATRPWRWASRSTQMPRLGPAPGRARRQHARGDPQQPRDPLEGPLQRPPDVPAASTSTQFRAEVSRASRSSSIPSACRKWSTWPT